MASASMADKRRALAEMARDRSRGEGERRWVVWALAALAAAALVLGILWLMGFFSAPAAVRELRDLVDRQVEELGRAGRNEIAFAAAESGMGSVMERMRDVPRDYREQTRADIGRLFEARESAEIDSYFALPPDDRKAEMDRRIRADEERRKARDAERAQRAATAGDQANRGPAAGGPPQSAAAGGRSRRDGSEEGRNARMKAGIDRTTPEQRARRTEYRRVMEERRTQLGLGPTRRS
jgi:hypothetical protein